MISFIGFFLAWPCGLFSVLAFVYAATDGVPSEKKDQAVRDASLWAIACALFLLVAK